MKLKNKKTNIKKALAICVSMIISMTMLSSCGDSDKSYDADVGNYNNNSPQYNYDRSTNNYKNEMADTVIGEQLPNTEEYAHVEKNDYKKVSENPLSTFSTDVDTASYTNVRRMINNGETVDPDAVRTEEFINYFKYNYEQPADENVGISTELTDCPWNENAKLMRVGMQAKTEEVKDVPMNLVFLIDVSGSMFDEDKLPLVQKAFTMMAENLKEQDRISIVTYAGEERVVLEGEKGNNYREITNAINSLEAGGSTAGEAGIKKAYNLAEENFIKNGNNRIILATDGDLNVGVSTPEELTALVEKERETGVYLSVLGFGTGNLKDNRLEALADNGNGNYAYIDSIDEAKRVLVSEMSGTLFTVAKDSKIQVEFNPENVYAYKLIGYENRALDDKDFEDDTKDAGDIGAGQQVTALYEIITSESDMPENSSKGLKYQENSSIAAETESDSTVKTNGKYSNELCTVSMRYKKPDEDKSRLISQTVDNKAYTKDMSDNTRLATLAAIFAMNLRKEIEFDYDKFSQELVKINTNSELKSEQTKELEDLAAKYYN